MMSRQLLSQVIIDIIEFLCSVYGTRCVLSSICDFQENVDTETIVCNSCGAGANGKFCGGFDITAFGAPKGGTKNDLCFLGSFTFVINDSLMLLVISRTRS